MSLRLLKLLSADALVAGAIRNILKLILRLENILSNLYSAKAFNSSNAPNCFLKSWHCEPLLCDSFPAQGLLYY